MSIIINNKSYELPDVRLKSWIELMSIQEDITISYKNKDYSLLFDNISKFASKLFPEENYEELFWMDVLQFYTVGLNHIWIKSLIPLVQILQKDQKKDPWDYKGRDWYYWLHIFASTYHWSDDTVSNLKVDDAFSLLQEIFVDKQLQREWEWQRTELAYPYNKETKESKFSPLPRPVWMTTIQNPEAPKVEKILKSMMPMGMIQTDEIMKHANIPE